MTTVTSAHFTDFSREAIIARATAKADRLKAQEFKCFVDQELQRLRNATRFNLDLRKALDAAAVKAGFDASAVCWASVCLNCTWGDQMGYVFYGGTEEVNARTAKWFETWYKKYYAPKRCYETQTCVRPYGTGYFCGFENGNSGFTKAPSPHALVCFNAHAVATVYYPCAD